MLHSRTVVIGWLLIAALTASCTVAGKPVAQRTTPASAAPSASAPSSAASVSDEDQIRETLAALQDAYNTQNWDAYLQLLCSSMREKFTGPILDSLKKTRRDQGLSRETVIEIAIHGDNATATVEGQNEVLGTQTLHLPLLREDGWKVCVPDTGVTG